MAVAAAAGGDQLLTVLKCVDHNIFRNEDDENEVIIISTNDVFNWNYSLILQHRIIKVIVQTNRLIQQSTYFHGLLAGNFSDSDVEVLVQWDQATFLCLLSSLFGSPLNLNSQIFLSIYEGALYFGIETILSKCKTWLINAISVNGVTLVQLDDLVSIWRFGSELVNYFPELCTSYLAKNFIWAISCTYFRDVPHDLLLSTIKHPHLTVESEKQLCDALLAWIAANNQRCTEDVCINLLKQIRISLLPLWFAAGKNTFRCLSVCSNESFYGDISLRKQPLSRGMDALTDGDLQNLRIRLTEFTQKVNLSGCPWVNPTILLLSMLPCSFTLEPLLRKKVEELLINHKPLNEHTFKISRELFPNLTFEAVDEIDISNCPMLHLEVAIECFSKSFPSLRKLKAANHLDYSTAEVLSLMKKCPRLCDIDLTVDVSPAIPTRVSILSSLESSGFKRFSRSYMSRQWPCDITKLTLEGRNDFSDADLLSISIICVSLTYISLKGCSSLSDDGISSLICKCLKLNSIVACDTYFGQQSVLALCSTIACYDDVAAEHSEKKNHNGYNLQLLHIGGCKGINVSSFSKLMSRAYTLKNLCLRDTEVVDDGLFNFVGSSLEVLDVSNTKVSATAVAHVISRNRGLKCLKARGCNNLLQQECKSIKNLYVELGKSCKVDEISVGWGFSYVSLEALKPAVSSLKAIEVSLGGMLGHNGLKLLPSICPLLKSVVLYFQVLSDDLIVNMLESLRHLESLALCHCFGETSSSSFKVSMPNLRKLRLERVAPWMNNDDLVSLSQNCANLVELSLLGCRLLNTESQKIISNGWPVLTSIHLERWENGRDKRVPVEIDHFLVRMKHAVSDCRALEDILLRHNGFGIQKGFIRDAVTKLPMLRKISLDICDAKDGRFDIPEFRDRHFLSHVKIARCKSQKCAFDLEHVGASRSSVHRETLVLVWDSKQLTKTVVKERV